MAAALDLPLHAQLAADLAHRAQRVDALLLTGRGRLFGHDLGVKRRKQARDVGGVQRAGKSKPQQRHAYSAGSSAEGTHRQGLAVAPLAVI
ncbi:hypothetical protein D3C76_1556370 [compost metagenome]